MNKKKKFSDEIMKMSVDSTLNILTINNIQF